MSKENKITFDIDYAEVIDNDDSVSIVEMDILHTGKNKNGSNLTKDGVEKSLGSIFNKPIVAIYDCDVKSLSEDFTSHAKDDTDVEKRVCVGIIPMEKFSEPTWIECDDGYERLRVKALIFSYYCPDVIRILQNRNDNTKVSIEINPIETHEDDDGTLIIDEWQFLSCCLLGAKIGEGMNGSNLKVLRYSQDEAITKANEYVLKYNQKSQIDIFEKIKNNNKKGGNMEHRELENLLWKELSDKMYTMGKETYHKYYIERIYDTHIIVNDNEDGERYKFKYHIDENGNVKIDFTTKKPLEDDLKKFSEEFMAKDKLATENAIKVNKSKDAMVETAWGAVDKSNLKKTFFKTKNYKTTAKDIFLRLEKGWEDGKEGALGYPVMQLNDGEWVYNRSALASAKGYAEKNNETEVLAKLKKIYKSLGLEFAIGEPKGKVMFETSDTLYKCKEFVDEEDEIEEEVDENLSDEEKKLEKDKVEMSADMNVDATANQELLEKEAEQNKELAKDDNPNLDKFMKECADYKAKCEDYEKQIKEMEDEVKELRNFKFATENKQKDFKINQTMAEIEELPKEKKKEFLEKAKEYSLENINEWENLVKAEAYTYAKKSPKNDGVVRMSIWGNEFNKPKSNGLWD